jgi:hypothetical protein
MDWRNDAGRDLDADSDDLRKLERNDGAIIDMDTSNRAARSLDT